MKTAGRENVAVFNPLVLALPNWHPDGPDGDVDGFVIPFVAPAGGPIEDDNRDARIMVKYDAEDGWAAWTQRVNDCSAYTPEQARALAGAWIRAAELLENVTKRAPAPAGAAIVDAEVLEGDGCTCLADRTVSNFCGLHGDPTNPGGDCK